MDTPSTCVSSATSPATSIHSKHPFKEPKQVEAIAALRELLGPSNDQYDDGVSQQQYYKASITCYFFVKLSTENTRTRLF